jgi:hypothetical protein
VALSVALIRLAERIDHILHASPEPSDDVLAHVAKTTDCQYLGFDARDLRKFWDELSVVQREAAQIF